MNLYKCTYCEYVVQVAYIVAENYGDAENCFLQWVGQPITSIEFVSDQVYIHEEAADDPKRP